MSRSVASERLAIAGWGVILVVAVLGVRVALLAWSEADLYVDEAQYWLWGQELAWGYYSKPPLIGWVIRAFTEIGGDTAFWVRLPAVLFHGAAALILMRVAWGWAPGWPAVLTGLVYLTMPGIALGSLLVSTDTFLLPFFAIAVGLYLSLTEEPSPARAVLMGAALGVGFLAKYAALYFVIAAGLAMLVVPTARLPWRETALAALAFAVVIAGNLWWNLQNGLSTVEHTLDNVDWVRDGGGASGGLNLWGTNGALEFFGVQALFFGPVFYAVWLGLCLGWGARGPRGRLLVMLSLPIVLAIVVQAALSRAYGNWAAPAYVAAALLAVPWMAARAPRWLGVGLVLNGAVALALPLAATQADSLRLAPDQPLLLRRYVGRAEMTAEIAAVARAEGLGTIVADHRAIIADLFWRTEGEFALYAPAPQGRPRHHYALKFPRPADSGAYLWVAQAGDVPRCAAGPAQRLRDITREDGAYRGQTLTLYAMPEGCAPSQEPVR